MIAAENMADAEDGFESSCHTMIDLESLGTGTPNSSYSTPDLELRGNESCLVDNSKQTPKGDGSPAINSCESSFPNETSTAYLHSKKRELDNNEASSSGANCKE